VSFLSAGFLAGLFAIGVPLAIHLFAKRKRVHMPWGAMRFLAEAKPNWKKRTLRLQDWLVMVIRIIAVALLVLAFARPIVERSVPPASGEEYLLIIDRSASTSLGSNAIADLIFQRTEAVLDVIPEDARLRILVNGISHELHELPPLVDDSLNDTRNRSHWLASLKELKPAIHNIDWPTAIDRALGYPILNPDLGERRIVIIADAAIHGYPHADIIDKPTIVDAWNIESNSVALLPTGMDPQTREMPNLCVDSITPDRQRVTPGEDAVLRAIISNRGNTTSAPTTANWRGKNQSETLTETKIPPLDPGTRHELVLRRAFPNAGSQALQLSIFPADQTASLTIDNEAAAVVDIVDQVRVISVTDEAPELIRDDDQRFTQWAFAAAIGGSDSIFTVESIKINAFPALPLDDIAVIIWAAGNRDPNAVAVSANKLHDFVTGGGGLWFRPPVDLDINFFNTVFFPHDFGLSPAAIDSVATVTGSNEQRVGLRPSTDGSKLQQLGLAALTELQSRRHFQLRTPIPPSSKVLSEFEGSAPFLITRQLGRGRVSLTTLNAHPQWGNLAACSGYVPFVRELLWHLAADHLPNPNLSSTDTSPWHLLGSEDSVRMPNGDWISAEKLNEKFSQLAAPGLYLVESADDGSHTPYSVGRIAGESDIRAVPEEYLKILNGIEGLTVLDADGLPDFQNLDPPAESPTRQSSSRNQEITLWLLIGLIGFLILELITAQQLLTRRRKSSGRALVK